MSREHNLTHVTSWPSLDALLCITILVSCTFFQARERQGKGGLFWIYALELRRCFLRVVHFSCSRSLPDFDSNFLWMMADWVSRFPRHVLAKQEPFGGAKSGDRKTKTEGGRNNFSYAGSCRTSLWKMGVRKLKICKFGLVSKICCFFGSLSCVFVLGELMRWNAATQDGAVFCWTKSWTDFDAGPDDD